MEQSRDLRSAWILSEEPYPHGNAALGRRLARERADDVVIATLERSGLIEPEKPLRPQKADANVEQFMDKLFEVLSYMSEADQ
jgi:hypothetical protein